MSFVIPLRTEGPVTAESPKVKIFPRLPLGTAGLLIPNNTASKPLSPPPPAPH